jgi:type I restriction enzyme, S subunit
MAGEWPQSTVEKIAAKTRNAVVGGPFGSNLVSRDYVNEGVPVIRGQNMASRWVSGEFVFVSTEKAQSLESNLALPGDIVFTQRGTLGQVSLVPDGSYRSYLVSQSQMKLTVNRDIAEPRFFYYVFTSSIQQEYIRQHAIQTGVPHTNLGILRATPIPLPPLREQIAIAHVLGTLDDKIELNRRMSETLEAMARALFKSWFIDFDPVRAKMQGRDTGLPKHIADLFPDRLVDSELGEIPEGWNVALIGNVAEVIDCLHAKKPDRRDSGRPLLQLVNIRDDGLIDMTDTYLIEEADYRKWISRMEASQGDCVITNVGRVGAVAQIPAFQRAALGRNMTGLRCRQNFPFPTMLIEILLSSAMREEIARKMDTGTILDALNVRNIPQLRFICSKGDVLDLFEKYARPIRARMEELLHQSRTFATLRDTLLPKLISGELRVRDAEKFISRR